MKRLLSSGACIAAIIAVHVAIAAPEATAAERIRIGAILPLSGNNEAQGQSMRDGLQLAIDEINGRGGVNGRRLELVLEDSKSNAEAGIAAFARSESGQRPLIYFTYLSSVSMGLAPLAEEKHVVLTALSTVAADLTKSREWVFRYWSLSPDSVKALMRIVQDLKIRTLGIIYQNDEAGISHQQSMANAFLAAGGRARSVMVELTDTDFRSKIDSLRDNDAIFVAATGKVVFGILKQVWEAKYGGKILSISSAAGQPALLRQPEMEGIYVSVPMIYNANYLYAKEATAKFEARFHKPFDQYGACSYDFLILLAGLLEDKDLSRQSVKDLLESGFEYSGVFGHLSIKPGQHELSIPLYPAQVVNGSLKYR
jgi:branched-chain amino acid transport system substrate-binding protein